MTASLYHSDEHLVANAGDIAPRRPREYGICAVQLRQEALEGVEVAMNELW